MKKKSLNLIPVSKPGIKKDLLTMKLTLILLLFSVLQVSAKDYSQNTGNPDAANQSAGAVPETIQQQIVSGTITDETGSPLPGANIQVDGTLIGSVTDLNGKYSIEIPGPGSTLVFSFIGYLTEKITLTDQTVIDVELALDVVSLDEVIVVGYGTQKKSDITGTVASLSKERLEMLPNLNIAQAIQGSIPGVMIQTSSAGASPDEQIMIRGRNSIGASNNPLIIIDGLPYEGNISDINPNDVLSIEVLKDASASAIYGSRGANGVVLVTTKGGIEGKATVSYDGYYSIQNYSNLPDILDGAEFYDFKTKRAPLFMTLEEQAIYDAGTWVDWYDLLLRQGSSQQHNLSVSGGSQNTKYYISGGLLDIKGLTVNDDYLRVTSRVNIETQVNPWLKIGTRSQFSFDDKSGVAPSWSDAYRTNPLSKAYDEDGNPTVRPMEGVITEPNPLQGMLFTNIDQSSTFMSNNYALIDFPFIQGLSYRINAGFRSGNYNAATYRGRNTLDGLVVGGSSDTDRTRNNSAAIENILTYNKDFGKHTVFGTGLYSFESNKNSSNLLAAEGYPNDFLLWHAAAQAELVTPDYPLYETNLISQMLRVNYSYDSRYLLTLTGRRDGFSGFGAETKWGIFPSVALGWNIANESFFTAKDIFNQLKLRASYGLNGNQAVGPYETISRLEEFNMVDDKNPVEGYRPSVLGQDNLGWESSKTLNLGLDYGILSNRVSGDINYYITNTENLLLDRTISPIQGITSITQNIGKTRNTGFELSVNSRNIVKKNFQWSTTVNLSFNKNEIISLYGMLDENGEEVDDVANGWFIGKPISANYDFEWIGTWQTEEAEEATKWGTQPGFVKLRDVNGDYTLDSDDQQFIGQRDPTFLWGMSNTFSYKNFKLNIFIHGVHGITAINTLMTDNVTAEARRNTMKKDWWTPDNPTNDWVVNHLNAEIMGGINAQGKFYENASFIRIKDISLSYDIPAALNEKISMGKIRFYIAAKNLFTFTEWNGLDPELSSQRSTPLQREFVMGVNLSF